MDYVYLQCNQVGRKLRVNIISHGYNSSANCQFPRAIRAPGRKYKVPSKNVTISNTRGRFFYRVSKNDIEIVNNVPDDFRYIRPVSEKSQIDYKNVSVDKIYKSDECLICLEGESCMVFVPCGHMSMDKECSNRYKDKRCFMCRTPYTHIIHKDDMT